MNHGGQDSWCYRLQLMPEQELSYIRHIYAAIWQRPANFLIAFSSSNAGTVDNFKIGKINANQKIVN